MIVLWEEVPENVKEAVIKAGGRFLPLLPRWVEKLSVKYLPPEEDNVAGVMVYQEYRLAKLCIHPLFMTLDEGQQAFTMLHEFVHVPQGQMSQAFWNLLQAAVKQEDPLFDWAEEEHRKATEAFTCDMEYGIARLLGIEVPLNWPIAPKV